MDEKYTLGEKMKLHPLINEESPHYDTNSTSAIEQLEKRLSVTEMMGFCKASIFKYLFRLDEKGQKEGDLKKIETYENYLEVLKQLDDAGYFFDTVALAFEKSMIQYRYR